MHATAYICHPPWSEAEVNFHLGSSASIGLSSTRIISSENTTIDMPSLWRFRRRAGSLSHCIRSLLSTVNWFAHLPTLSPWPRRNGCDAPGRGQFPAEEGERSAAVRRY